MLSTFEGWLQTPSGQDKNCDYFVSLHLLCFLKKNHVKH